MYFIICLEVLQPEEIDYLHQGTKPKEPSEYCLISSEGDPLEIETKHIKNHFTSVTLPKSFIQHYISVY